MRVQDRGRHERVGAQGERSGAVGHRADDEPVGAAVARVLPNSFRARAGAVSAARPGARREVLENYVKRLERLEELATSFSGVSKAFALQAGREVRIIVESSQVSDEQAFWLTKDITKKIENELQYPGQIKVTLIRETRVVDYAK